MTYSTLSPIGLGFADTLTRNLIMGIVPVLLLAVFIFIAIKMANRKRVSDVQQKTTDMLNEDYAAGRARSQDVSEEFYYTADLAALPVVEYSADDVARPHPCYVWQEKALKAAERKMLRFDRTYSNVELKQMYGSANLEYVAQNEENFTNFIHAMRYWAEALIADGRQDEAQRVLQASIDAGSELSQSYTLLGDIYANAGNHNALKELHTGLQKSTMPGKGIAIGHIEQLLNAKS